MFPHEALRETQTKVINYWFKRKGEGGRRLFGHIFASWLKLILNRS